MTTKYIALSRGRSTPRAAGALVAAVLLAAARCAGAWGTPHTEITRHGLRMLPASDRLETRLGGVRQMEDLAWGGDYQAHVHARYYVDDYLLFPGFPRHSSHLMPPVAETWQPYFQRTLRALRAESPQNAARWLGSFLHFVQDSGSPPHALPTGGVLHTRMENYVLALDVRITGYRPRLLARAEADAPAALRERMEGLVRFSRERAEKLLPLAEKDDRLACEPLIMECAQETMRVVADVTHTLMVLSAAGPAAGSASLHGEVRAPVMPEFPLAPVKVLVEGTEYATIADAAPMLPGAREFRARYVLGDLEPGTYTLAFMRTGCRTVRKRVRLERGGRHRADARLASDGPHGNLVRNADFGLRWLQAGQPDHWTRVGREWRSDAFPTVPGATYEFGARGPGGRLPVRVRASDDPRMPASAPLLAISAEGRARVDAAYAQIRVEADAAPAHVFASPVPAPAGP